MASFLKNLLRTSATTLTKTSQLSTVSATFARSLTYVANSTILAQHRVAAMIMPAITSQQQVREYKLKVRLRKRCKSCYFVWRNGRLYVECKEHPRHKQHHIDSLLKGFDNIGNGYIKGQPTM
jgi:large subunit ribosomal protein L36